MWQRSKMRSKQKLRRKEEEGEDVPINTSPREVPRVIMNKSAPGNKCTACDKSFPTNKDREDHMSAKHSQKQCKLCEKMCASETELVRRHTQCLQQGISTVTCPKCSNNFTSFELRRHKQQCHGKAPEYDCSDCVKTGRSKEEIKKHISIINPKQRVVSLEVCYHWRRGKCTKCDKCGYSHVRHQDQPNSTFTQEKTQGRQRPFKMDLPVSGRREGSPGSTTKE